MDENQEGLTIGEFFRRVWSEKLIALIVAVAITLVGTLGLFFGYNAMSAEYSLSYNIALPNASGDFSNGYTYPDGTRFYYQSLVSDETLNEIKATDSRFAKIDNRSISVEYTYDEGASEFVLKAKKSAFANIDDARDFFTAIANYPIKYLNQINFNYQSGLDMFLTAKTDTVTDYEGLLELLSSQLNEINSAYASLVTTYGNAFTVTDEQGNDVSLATYAYDVQAYVNSSEMSNMQRYVRQNAIVKSEAVKSNYQLTLVDLEKDLLAAQKTLEVMQTHQQVSDTGSTAEIRAQQNVINAIQRQIDDAQAYMQGTVNTEYMANLDTIYSEVSEYAKTLEDITKQVYVKVSTVIYPSNSMVQVDELGVMISGVISLLVGVVVAIIVGYCLASSKLKKKAAAEMCEIQTADGKSDDEKK